MKKKSDPRHQKRKRAVQALFAWTLKNQNELPQNETTKKIIQKVNKIDDLIKKHASAWPIEQISPVDLSILRFAIWEVCFFKKTPLKVSIDEAVELAKEFGSETSSSFINGVLGSIAKEEMKTTKNKTKK